MGKEWTVAWTIDVHAESTEEAARKALAIQRDPASTAVVFHVTDGQSQPVVIDLDDEEAGCASSGAYRIVDERGAVLAPNLSEAEVQKWWKKWEQEFFGLRVEARDIVVCRQADPRLNLAEGGNLEGSR